MPRFLKFPDVMAFLLNFPFGLVSDLIALALNPPDLTDSPATRTWAQAMAEKLSAMTVMTRTKIDDFTMEQVTKVLDNDSAWSIIHKLLSAVIKNEAANMPSQSDPEVIEVASTIGIDPLTLVAIISAIVQLVRFLRDRRDDY